LIIDLGLHGCSFILPKDMQITDTELTITVQETTGTHNPGMHNPGMHNQSATLPFQLVWIDEHFSKNEQKIGVQFIEPSVDLEKTLQASMKLLESDQADSVRCLIKTKEASGFF
jgi:hypothetical protein